MTGTNVLRDVRQSLGRSWEQLTEQRIETASLGEKVAFYLSTALVLGISLYPFYIMVKTSLLPASELYSLPPELLVEKVSLGHYRTLFSSNNFPFLTFMRNSLIVATTTAILSVIFSTFGAYSFARLDYPGRKLFSRGVIIVYMFSGILLVVPLYQVIIWLNLIDTLASLVLTYLVQSLPLTLYLLGNYFRSVPSEIEEAAMIDGYSRLEVILKVTIPMSAPAIAVAFVYAFLIGWNEYLFASIFLKSRAKYTIPIGMEKINAAFQTVWGDVLAAAVVTTIPVVLLFFYLEKYIVGGMNYESIKDSNQ